MQTFLPYASYVLSAACLDRQRLGKQRIEVLQIHNALTGVKAGWQNHPAVLMWKGYEDSLLLYGAIICDEWQKRGYKDTVGMKIVMRCGGRVLDATSPPWNSDEEFHLAHRSNLIRKDPTWYRELWPEVPDNLPYIWPVQVQS